MPLNPEVLKKVLIERRLIPQKAIDNLSAQAKTQAIDLEDFLYDREVIVSDKLAPVVSELYGVQWVRLSEKTIPDSLLRVVPYALAAHQNIIPFEHVGNEIKIATACPDNDEIISFLEKKTGLKIKVFYATKKAIKIALKAYNKDVNEKFNQLLEGALKDRKKIESLKDAAKILDTIILFGFQNNASDIHMEPHKDFLIIRYRIDGILQTIAELPIEVMDLITTRVKVLANMRTDEHRAAQDGRFKIDLEGNEITMRVSIVPTYDGEKTVLRLLTSTNQALNLETMGYSERNLRVINENIKKTNGIILITGPTGSGKTTTLYAVLRILSSPEVNISTIEDPIEYRLEGINQIQVTPKTGLTFAAGLRSLLRQDPDVIMVGEIRDEETGSIAVNASLTGHVVLATLHTNDAPSTLPRMKEMGIEPFLLSATVKMVIAQRLVRTICSKCKVSFFVNKDQLTKMQTEFNFNEDLIAIFEKMATRMPKLKASLDADKIEMFKGKGCATCSNSGYKGRTSIAEALEVSDSIKDLMMKNASPQEIGSQAEKEGMPTMFVDGVEKAFSGVTTLEEVLRVIRS
jgi:type IV pilus assembly protein PilB